jgi:hypothetical protein
MGGYPAFCRSVTSRRLPLVTMPVDEPKLTGETRLLAELHPAKAKAGIIQIQCLNMLAPLDRPRPVSVHGGNDWHADWEAPPRTTNLPHVEEHCN